ncbi:MAG: P-II family nitrogen regulator [Candidatus Accumulibacter sp.]|jgi:nitrogen regulatory protein PII|nr:P-II family nitrogen regulator [Accumulibacter sp.]
MENADSMKALFIIVNMGFGSQAVQIANEAGAGGAVIINAIGTGMARKSLLGIPVESEKEIVLTMASEETAEKVVAAIKEKSGVNSPAHGICLVMPVGQITPLDTAAPPTVEE